MVFPKQIQNLIDAFERLPGVGPKSAARLTFYLLHVPQPEIDKLGDSILNLKKDIFLCSICKNISDSEICEFCSDTNRDQSVVCVVEQPLDVFSLEKADGFKGVYHVLHGIIDPLHNIGPDELYVKELLDRVRENVADISEVILAMNPTMEGEATAMYLAKQIKGLPVKSPIKITRLGVGMPIGGDMQYADQTTLSRALDGRREF